MRITMKSKKYLAVALSISILASSFSGVYISYAGNNIPEREIIDEDQTSRAPEPYIIEWEPEVNNDQSDLYLSNMEDQSIIKDTSLIQDKIIIEDEKLIEDSIADEQLKASNIKTSISDKTNINSDFSLEIGNDEDIYNIGKADIEKLIQEGFTIQDIIDADNIANEIGEDPLKILEMTNNNKKSIQGIKKDILQENKDKALNKLKIKYEKEYKKLVKANLTEDQIIAFLGYIDINDLKMTDDLIKEYRKLGVELFKKNNECTLSAENKKKYKISDKDEKILNDKLIQAFEKYSKESKISVQDIIHNYIINYND